jgi:hypothetical protein
MRSRNWIAAFMAAILGTPLIMAAEKAPSDKVAAEKAPSEKASAPAGDLPALPEGVSSFGGAVEGPWLYVYSGHIGTAHSHSKQNLSKNFLRLRLDAPSEWETLPVGPGLQGLPLVAHGGGVIRVGGLSARNEQGRRRLDARRQGNGREVAEDRLGSRSHPGRRRVATACRTAVRAPRPVGGRARRQAVRHRRNDSPGPEPGGQRARSQDG